ncbi:YopX family protein [Phocoenobacter skyensis]|uniref:Phage uncharacterized protein TIGR01671 n=1 Tax=Phocoenobacter skyensis TaxID=97481 RepID=A0A1H7XN84_9PAST|nr:YopX family protein [Pasteurella skyensis]MDP8184361.1 YopX family protein [Pasteurella skyensis]QLB22631.1 hypothetical protein A6B44_05185 [Pasteurella skyensis]SEM34678.1 phage uncharacterized protein TIGR01671 [Pasteurella skyensis]
MRELEFRAWDIEKRQMLPVVSLGFHTMVSPPNDDDEGNNSYELQTELYPDGSGKITGYVMQYIGLKDCEDKPIYEGDIVKFTQWWFDREERETTLIGYIKYSAKELCYVLAGIADRKFKEDTSGSDDCPLHLLSTFTEDDFEVIGNIYQNPELLEGLKCET